jgi:GNAT superfamily N-acetyltransferase
MTPIRVATDRDVESLFDIRTSVLENHQSREDLACIGITPQSVAQMLRSSSRAWIASEAGHDVAFSMANAVEATIFAMFVRPASEGRGLGRVLMKEAEEWLFAQGCTEIWLLTDANPRVRASGFYRHLGWEDAGVQDDGQVKFTKRRPKDWTSGSS